jgi:SAM-dependent methyltransferase
MIKDQMEHIYKNVPLDKIPWNLETIPKILKQLIESKKIGPCKSLEMGCGTGQYVIYLSKHGFQTTGIDISKTAVQYAMNSASEQRVGCHFFVSDVLGDLVEIKDTYDFVYDWELLHHIFPRDRKKYFNNVHRLLNSGGHYLSVSFSEMSPQFGGKGKYRKTPLDTVLYFSSEHEIEKLVEHQFNILELNTVEIQGKYAPHIAIYAFLKKKEIF